MIFQMWRISMIFFVILCMIVLVFYVAYKYVKQTVKQETDNNERDFYLNKMEALNREHVLRIQDIREEYSLKIDQLNQIHKKELIDKLEKTRVQTRAVNFGMHAQHTIVPLLAAEKAGSSNNEIRWFGDSIDFICFKGLDEEDGQVDIIFADSKTSKGVKEVLDNRDKWSTHKTYSPGKFLNKRQKRIVDAIKNNRLSFQLWMADEDGRFDVAEFGKNGKSLL